MFLKEFRNKIGLTQKELAQILNIQSSALGRYESLQVSPSFDFLKKYCETLNANPNFLFFGQEPHLLSASPSVSVENGYLLNDLSSLLPEEDLTKKLREITIEILLQRVQGIIKEDTFVKLLDALSLGDHVRQRPFLFLYYIFQMVSVAKHKPEIKINNSKEFIINTINNFKTISFKNQPIFTSKIKQTIITLIEKSFNQNECQLLIEQADIVLLLLERTMSQTEIKLHRGVFHA